MSILLKYFVTFKGFKGIFKVNRNSDIFSDFNMKNDNEISLKWC